MLNFSGDFHGGPHFIVCSVSGISPTFLGTTRLPGLSRVLTLPIVNFLRSDCIIAPLEGTVFCLLQAPPLIEAPP